MTDYMDMINKVSKKRDCWNYDINNDDHFANVIVIIIYIDACFFMASRTEDISVSIFIELSLESQYIFWYVHRRYLTT